MDIRFHGKRALVTGAGKGIGRALTLKLIEGGAAAVVAVSRTQSDLDELKKISPKIHTINVDVGKWEATQAALQNIGPIDLLVNNAAIMDVIAYGKYTEEDVDRTLNINLKSVVNITQIVVEKMKAQGGGVIVNVSSMMSLTAAPSFGVYGASKSAMDQMTRSMALEFGPHKIRVNSVNPTAVRTRLSEKEGMFDADNEFATKMIERTPMRRFAEVEDVVNPILFLLSDKANMITGITMPIDGGLNVCYN